MYEPVWFFDKTLSALAEGVGVIAPRSAWPLPDDELDCVGTRSARG